MTDDAMAAVLQIGGGWVVLWMLCWPWRRWYWHLVFLFARRQRRL